MFVIGFSLLSPLYKIRPREDMKNSAVQQQETDVEKQLLELSGNNVRSGV